MKINIPLFYPLVTEEMKNAAFNALGQRMIGQGKTVVKFENKLRKILGQDNLITVNNGTAALELAYDLAGLKPGDEVISPVFTCTATNIPLARRGVKIIFADIKPNFLIDWDDAKKKITKKTKAIVNVHLFDQDSPAPKLPVKIIGDASQHLAKTTNEDFTTYSFNATKQITTVDGGVLTCKNASDLTRAKLLRWYGIDRETEHENIEGDISEAGYKFHMNNVTAAIGLAALTSLPGIKAKLTTLQKRYLQSLKDISGIEVIGGSPFLIHSQNREKLVKKLAGKGVEVGLVHKRNDQYKVFGGKKLVLPNMNKFENTYLLLPCRANMSLKDVNFICSIIKNHEQN